MPGRRGAVASGHWRNHSTFAVHRRGPPTGHGSPWPPATATQRTSSRFPRTVGRRFVSSMQCRSIPCGPRWHIHSVLRNAARSQCPDPERTARWHGVSPAHLARCQVDRLADSYRFLPRGHGVVVKLGGFRHQDFWLFDVRSGARRQLTRLKAGESVSRFDVSRDGRRILFERAEENSDVALIELPRQ